MKYIFYFILLNTLCLSPVYAQLGSGEFGSGLAKHGFSNGKKEFRNTLSQPKITSYEMQGNLESNHALNCIAIKEAKNNYNPSDLFIAAKTCMKSGDYDKGAVLFMLAGAYGNFDKQRVADKTAHQAVAVLILNNFASLNEEEKTKWKTAMQKYQTAPGLTQLCADFRKLGQPDYYPAYMIQHGMGVMTAALKKEHAPQALVEDFNAEKAWDVTMHSYLHCSDK